MRRLLALGAVAIAALLAVPPATAATDGPAVYAHRGGAGIAPENTMGAFRQAHKLFGKQGVWLEMDTQLTSDGVLVVLHDDTLDRTTNCTGAVIEKTASEVTACDASKPFPDWGKPEPVPTLEQVLREAKKKRWRLSVEIKNIPGESNFDPAGTIVADALVDLVERVGFLEKRLIVQSFFPTSLDRVEERAPEIRTALLTTSDFGFLVTENATYSAIRGYEVSSPDFSAPDMSAESVAFAHGLGLDVVTWTVNDAADITRIAGYGVDGIISDRPDVVYATLG